MKKILLLFLLAPFFVIAQFQLVKGPRLINKTNFGYLSGDDSSNSFLKSSNKTILYKDIEGSPYIDNNQEEKDNNLVGDLFNYKSEHIGKAFIRYNAYTDNMEVSLMEDGKNYSLLKKKTKTWFILLGSNKYGIYEYYQDDLLTNGYFKIIHSKSDEKHTLLKKEKINFIKGVNEKNGFLDSTPPKFKKAKDIYYLKTGDRIQKLPSKRKKFISFFTNNSKLIENYMKEKKLKISNEKDIIEIIKYYNSLSK